MCRASRSGMTNPFEPHVRGRLSTNAGASDRAGLSIRNNNTFEPGGSNPSSSGSQPTNPFEPHRVPTNPFERKVTSTNPFEPQLPTNQPWLQM